MRNYLISVLSSIAVLPVSALAQDDPLSIEPRPAVDPTITVLARGMEEDVATVAEPVTVIAEDEIRSVQGADITRVFERLPGVTTAPNGGQGGFVPVFVRGASSEQLLVLVDGVRVADAASPGGGFDFGNLLAGSIEKVELIRSPGSVVWGSDAIAGVMNLTTRLEDGLTASAEYGTDDTIYTVLSGGLVRDRVEAGLTGSWYRTDGFSTAAAGTEADGFEQWQVAGRGSAELLPELRLEASGRYSEGELEQDGFPAPTYAQFTDTADVQDTRLWSGRVGARYRLQGLQLRGGYSISDTRRLYTGESYGDFPYETSGRTERAEIFARTILWRPELVIDAGADREWNRFDDSGDQRTAHTTSGHALAGWYGYRFTASAGLRYDDHSTFGDAWSFGASAGYRLAEGVRLRASYNEGFKAPTLFQSVSSLYGNAGLSPERSKSWDLGLHVGEPGDVVRGSLSLYRRDSRDLIDYVSCFGDASDVCTDRPFGTYVNIGRARAEGMELELEARPAPSLRIGTVYSLLRARDRTAGSAFEGNELARRPSQALTVSGDWATPLGLSLGADLRLVGDSFDDRANAVPLDGFVRTDLRASYDLKMVELFGRVENLFGADYTQVAGYNVQGRAVHVGARLRL